MPGLSFRRKMQLALAVVLIAALVGGCASTVKRRGADDATVTHLMAHYREWYGTPYRYGGSSRHGVDCSAFVQLTYREVFGVDLPRRTEEQVRIGHRVSSGKLKSGDLVFFKTGWFKYHVGVYVEGGRFIHASESRGVIESSLETGYWSKKFWKARRVV